jgi:type IV pilus assembly protein PilC
LRERGWLVLEVRAAEAAGPVTVGWGTRLNPLAWLPPRSFDVELSLQQMAIMLRNGLTLLSALKTVAEYARRAVMRRVWLTVAERIQQGSSLTEAMAEHRCFGNMVIQLVRVGEQTGTLDAVVLRAAEALERRRLLRTQLLTALFYPTLVLAAAIGVAVYMIVGLIPKLRVFLDALGRKLPPLTQSLLDISAFFQTYGLSILLGILTLTVVVAAIYLWPPGRVALDRLMLRLPILGLLLRLAGTVQFAHGLGVMLQSGITLVEGLRTVEQLHRNRYLAVQVAEARNAVLRGSSLAEPLTQTRAYMPMLARMVAVGETAGTLDAVLREVARFHEAELQSMIRWFSAIIEPVIICVVGGIVGFVYIAFFVALFSVAGGAR